MATCLSALAYLRYRQLVQQLMNLVGVANREAGVQELIEARLNAALAKSMEEIRMLPNCIEEEVALEGKKVKVTTYHETLEGDKHHLIVQAIRPRWGGLINAAIAKGYELSGTANPRQLSVEELYDYT
jgi:hypothetical protein